MKQETFTTTILVAGAGKFLTQASNDIDIKDRIIAKRIAIGRYDSSDNWKEIDDRDAAEIEFEKRNKELYDY